MLKNIIRGFLFLMFLAPGLRVDAGGPSAVSGPVSIDTAGHAQVTLQGKVDQNNTRVLPLASGALYVGAATEVLDYAEVSVTVYADAPSALDGLRYQVSSNGMVWYSSGDTYTVASGSEKTFSFQPSRRFYRLTYQNGGTPQTVFDLEAILHKTRCKPSSHRISDMIVDDDDAELMKAVVTAQDENGDFVNVRAIQGDTGNNLKVSLDQIEPTTNSVQVIDYAHGELHEGRHFVAARTLLVPKAGTHNVLLLASDTLRWAHTTFEVETNDAAVAMVVYESPTYTATGTAIVAVNRNRNSSHTAGLQVFSGATITATGITLLPKTIGSGKTSGGKSRDNSEFILKQNTAYLLQIIEGNAAATNVNWEIDWYEHTNK